jgi:hypothetical protein
MIFIDFNFDFLDLHNVFFENYLLPVNLLDRSFLKQFKTFAVRVLSDLKILAASPRIFISDKTLLLMC